MTHILQEIEENIEYPVDFNGSQYEFENKELPLNSFNKYIKVEERNENSNVINICTTCEMRPSQMEDL